MSFTTLIEPAALGRILGHDDLLVVDCRFDIADPQRGAREYAFAHIPGAVYADLDRDLSDLWKADLGRHPLPDAEAFCEALGRWGWTPRTQVVAYDAASGANAAARLWWMLRLIGHRDAAVLDGGLPAWNSVAWPLSSDTVRRRCTAVEARFDAEEIVYTDTLQKIREDVVLLDARAAPRFRGEVEPIDSVAGHVPGARNRPFSDNLTADGRFKSAAALREEFSKLIAPSYPRDVVHMCGSGVTACHNLLAMEHAGLTGSRIYGPSWSGWIADPTRPVERSDA
ncbi:MAG TPA: sulfurtransferase [Rhodanobacteraceae bacterium]|nr:sulfurtransferase [Rhodanobacteraceae bacterium]